MSPHFQPEPPLAQPEAIPRTPSPSQPRKRLSRDAAAGHNLRAALTPRRAPHKPPTKERNLFLLKAELTSQTSTQPGRSQAHPHLQPPPLEPPRRLQPRAQNSPKRPQNGPDGCRAPPLPLPASFQPVARRRGCVFPEDVAAAAAPLRSRLLLAPAAAAAAAMISLSDTQKIGMGLTGFGVFFLFFGMILFFDKALLAIGNVLFVAGLAFVIGLERTFRFFFQKHKMKATGFFLGGVLIVLIGWPLIGMILEIYGFFLLFRGFFPVVVGFIRRVPVLGSLLNLPGISSLVDKVGESNNMV
uniref:Golgi transport 1B n=1 Tax=Anas platyrhynchos TaxID=8839 RepID=A0A8B9QZH3_ANAPL